MATATPERAALTNEELLTFARRLAGATMCSERTAKRWLTHQRVHAANAIALAKAAGNLGIKRAPPPDTAYARG